MPAKVSLISKRFGSWKVLADAPSRRRNFRTSIRYSLCQCDCGTEREVMNASLTHGKSSSCGCNQTEISAKANLKHGHAPAGKKSDTYQIWASMIQRCTNPKEKAFKNYGGRGITVCERWKKFENFLADMGTKPKGLTLERINNNGNYEPGNCRWATRKDQCRNKRNNRIFTVQGITGCMVELCEHFGISVQTVSGRINGLHWDIERAFTEPAH